MTRPLQGRRTSWSEGVEGGRIGTPTRSVTRTRTRPRSSAQILDPAYGTTGRDIRLCLDLYEHRVLTTDQAFELRFPTLRKAQKRLLQLHRRGILERFRPFLPTGSSPWHYILGDVGIAIVAGSRGVEPKELKISRDRLRALPYSPLLPHLVGVNGFFCRLAYRCRGRPDLRLAEWWSERRSAAEWRGLVRPDATARLRGPGLDLRFFFELDRGTESSSRLEQKLARYARAARIGDAPGVLLFLFPTERREAEARRSLSNPGLRLLTGARAAEEDPLDRVWLPVGGERRIGLGEASPSGGARG